MMHLGKRFGAMDDSPFGCCSESSSDNGSADPASLENSGIGEQDLDFSSSPSAMRTRNFRISPPDNTTKPIALRPIQKNSTFGSMGYSLPTSPPSSERTAFTVPSETGSDSTVSAYSIMSSNAGGLALATNTGVMHTLALDKMSTAFRSRQNAGLNTRGAGMHQR